MKQPWDDIENTLTIPRIKAYRDYWQNHPPVDLLAAAYIGYKPKKQTDVKDLLGLPGVNIKSETNGKR